MQVEFRMNQLQQAFQEHATGVRRWGAKLARRYVQRIEVLQAAKGADELFKIPSLKFHPLTARRKGEYALVLHGQMRLIVTFADPAMSIVWIEEVSDHYE